MDIFLTGLSWILSTVCGVISMFAAMHVSQRVDDPKDRAIWIAVVVLLPLVGSMIYFFTKYRRFREVGKGGLIFIPVPDVGMNEWLTKFFQLSESEKIGGVPPAPRPMAEEKKPSDY